MSSNRVLFVYENEVSLEKRKAESARIIDRYPTRIPIVCERVPEFLQKNNLPVLSKKKFLVPSVMTLAQFCCVLKAQIKEETPTTANKALYFALRNRMSPVMSKTLQEVYAQYKEDDGFLYLHFCEETVFGN